MASAALAVLGGHAGTQLTRTLERVVEEAQLTGELRLSGRKLKEFPKIAAKYNLVDTVLADLSKNKFSELPVEVCDYVSVERLDCYHNAIRTIPEAVICLHSLTHLNLSRNQLTTLPVTLCQLPVLQVLIVSNNKLVSLPEEIGCLDQLMELDVSCNEISHLPPQIEELENLKSLNLRRNFLIEVPIEVTTLPLIRLDISSNRIATLPTQLRRLDGLMELELENNPLTSPPSYLCTRGRVHIFKYLEIQAIKEDKKRGVIDTEFRRSNCKKLTYNSLNGMPLDSRTKRYTIDSGYNTSDGSGDRRWSQEFQDLSYEMDEARRLALRAAELTKEQRQDRERSLHVRLSQLGFNHGYSSSSASDVLQQDGFDTLSNASTPSTLSPNGKMHAEDLFTRRSNYEERKRKAERLRHEQIDGQKESQRMVSSQRSIDEDLMDGMRKKLENSVPNVEPLDSFVPHSTSRESIDGSKSSPHIPTYREYLEARDQQRRANNGSVYRRNLSDDREPSSPNLPESGSPSPIPSVDTNLRVNVTDGALVTNQMNTLQEEFRTRHDTIMQQQQLQAQLAQRRLDEKRKQQEALISYVRSQTSLRSPSENENIEGYVNHTPPPGMVNGTTSPLASNGQPTVVDRKVPSVPLSTGKPFEPSGPHFTFRREFDKAKEEAELIRQLRIAIEARLKVVLPDDTASALMDGVVLCHLANHVRPRSVASIHVPSPAVPKLTMAKCRRNVENFLDACRRIGIAEADLCSCEDVVLMRRLEAVDHTVRCLVARTHGGISDSVVSSLCLILFLGTCLLLYFLPPSP